MYAQLSSTGASGLAHLFIGNGCQVLEDDPLHSLAAGGRGQRPVVDEVFLRGVWQEPLQCEG